MFYVKQISELENGETYVFTGSEAFATKRAANADIKSSIDTFWDGKLPATITFEVTTEAPTVSLAELATLTDLYQDSLSNSSETFADPDNTPEFRAALLRDLEARRAKYSVENDCSQFHTRLAILQYREAEKAGA